MTRSVHCDPSEAKRSVAAARLHLRKPPLSFSSREPFSLSPGRTVSSNQVVGPPITVQIQQSGHGGGPARLSMPFGIGRLVQTTTGQHLLLTPAAGQVTAGQGAHAEGALGGVSQQQQQVMLATSAIQTTAVRTTAGESLKSLSSRAQILCCVVRTGLESDDLWSVTG